MSLLSQLISSSLLEQKKRATTSEKPVKKDSFVSNSNFAKAERVIAAAEYSAAQLLELERNEDGEL